MVRTTVIAALVVNDLTVVVVTGRSPIISLFGCMGSVTLHTSDSRKIRRAIDIVDGKGEIRNTDGRGPIRRVGKVCGGIIDSGNRLCRSVQITLVVNRLSLVQATPSTQVLATSQLSAKSFDVF